MIESTKLYLITNGEYSDYHVEGIFSTKEKAEEAKRLFASHNEIVEYELDGTPDHPQGMLRYQVQMDVFGGVRIVYQENAAIHRNIDWNPYGDGSHVEFHVWAKDERHAVKIANEKRAKLTAENRWTTNYSEWKSVFSQTE